MYSDRMSSVLLKKAHVLWHNAIRIKYDALFLLFFTLLGNSVITKAKSWMLSTFPLLSAYSLTLLAIYKLTGFPPLCQQMTQCLSLIRRYN